MSAEYVVYRNEILNFLRTTTIKFTPLADTMASNLLLSHGYVVKELEDNPYYLNLCGRYHSTETPMTVLTLETGQEAIFDRDFAQRYPKTAALYFVGSKEYATLCQKYPSRIGQIKSIVYPVDSLNTAITADNLTILKCDLNQLHPNERESMYNALVAFLKMFENRWYVPEYFYEEMYPLAVWSMLWYLLPQVLLAQRIANLKTDQVHPMHIWEYLTSKGLANYRDILSDKQSLFLYRNIDYLLRNKGKKSNLVILAENILKDLRVSLVGKTIFQQSETAAEECRTIPEIISDDVISFSVYGQEELESFASIAQINSRMVNEGLEHDASAEHVVAVEERLGQTDMNILATKLLELRKDTISTRYEETLCQFVMDSLVYRHAAGKLVYDIQFMDELTGMTLNLDIGQALALFYYCYYMNAGAEPLYIPTVYQPGIPYRLDKPTVPTHFYIAGYNYPLNTLINATEMVNEIPWDGLRITDHDEFMYLLSRQFRVMMKHERELRGQADYKFNQATAFLYDKLLYHDPVLLTLVPGQTLYKSWIESHDVLSPMLAIYKRAALSKERFWELASRLIEELLPIDNEWFDLFLGATKDKTALYNGLKNLFIQLCSYNVAFLDTDRSKNRYLYITPLCTHETDCQYSGQMDVNINVMSGTLDQTTRDTEILDYTNVNLGHLDMSQIDQQSLDVRLDLTVLPQHTDMIRNWKNPTMYEQSCVQTHPARIILGPTLTFNEAEIRE